MRMQACVHTRLRGMKRFEIAIVMQQWWGQKVPVVPVTQPTIIFCGDPKVFIKFKSFVKQPVNLSIFEVLCVKHHL